MGMGVDIYGPGAGAGGDTFGLNGSSGSHGGVGSFGASPDIDYGMGIYEQRLRGNSFQQVGGGLRLHGRTISPLLSVD